MEEFDGEFTPAQQEIARQVYGKKLTKSLKNKEDNVVYKSFIETDNYILEQIKVADVADNADSRSWMTRPVFVKYSKLNDEVEEVPEFEYEGKLYKPIVDDAFTKNGVKLPTGIKEYKNLGEITDQIRDFLYRNFEVNNFYTDFLPHLAVFYWVYEKFPFIPYVHFVGSTSTGKTTAMGIFGEVCYRGIDTTGSLTISAMFRLANSWGGTMLIDEFDNLGEDSGPIISFLKTGTSDRLLWRTEGEGAKEVKGYKVKSPKIFTSEHPITDAALQSRTLIVQMKSMNREIPLFLLPEDYAEAEEIRNKLLLWRLRNFNKIKLKDIKYGFPELKPFDRRVQQILTPSYYLADEETRAKILIFSKKQEEETLEERRGALNGVIFTKMLEIWSSGRDVSIKELTGLVNEESIENGYKEPLTEKKISATVRKILGFGTERRGHEQLSEVIVDKFREDEWCKYFGLTPGHTPKISSATSATSALASEDAEVTGEMQSFMDEVEAARKEQNGS